MTDFWTCLEEQGELTADIREEIVRRYGDRGQKALAIVAEHRVKRYLDFFVVVGVQDEYVVEDQFCTCRDYQFRGTECAHIVAVEIARRTGAFESYEIWYQDTLSA